jgi:hypothetical protein
MTNVGAVPNVYLRVKVVAVHSQLTMGSQRPSHFASFTNIFPQGKGAFNLDGGRVSAAAWISFLFLFKIAFSPCTCHPANLQETRLQGVRTLSKTPLRYKSCLSFSSDCTELSMPHLNLTIQSHQVHDLARLSIRPTATRRVPKLCKIQPLMWWGQLRQNLVCMRATYKLYKTLHDAGTPGKLTRLELQWKTQKPKWRFKLSWLNHLK